MSHFKELRDQLLQSRAEKEQARQMLFDARERLRKIEAERAELDRVFSQSNAAHSARSNRLKELRAEAEAVVKERGTAFGRLKQVELGRFQEWAVFTDPRERIENYSDEFPFLLMPVRIETRFKTVNEQQQLWVRIYPDECAVDTFEATLTEIEVESAKRYWIEIWRAGGIEDQERGAWRGLVASHRSGRAAWIVEHYQPLNIDNKPKKAKPTDIILVITTDQPLNAAEETATAAFWLDIWLADGDKNKEDAAIKTLQTAVGEARAIQIIKAYKPVNLDETPNVPKSEVVVQVATVVFPEPNATQTKQQSWSQAPHVNVLPDRFVLIGYAAGQEMFLGIGNPIPSPLVVGPDPSAAPDDQLQQKDGEIVIPEEMRWLVDFEKAIEVGMGFRINLTQAQAGSGFDRLLALGIRLSADESKSQTLIEELFQHHQNGRSGLSLLPQGTPTNNTENAGSGFNRSDDADASFDDNFKTKADDLFGKPEGWATKRDGQWLAEYLGIDREILKKTRYADATDQCEARAMNIALWPATFGYMMETMMHPLFDDQTVEQARWFFNNFVAGRGALPAIRIGSQPYGILPTTAFSRMSWQLSDRLPPIPGLDHPRNYRPFLRQVHGVLRKMDTDWSSMAKEASFVGTQPSANKDAYQILLDVIGLHSGSVEYHQRYAESLAHIFNLFNLSGLGGALIAALIAAGYVQSGMDLLRKLGYEGEATPDILDRFFLTSQNLLKGPVVDDRPLSQTEGIRKYTDEANEKDRRNYIEWLQDAAQTSLETIRQEKGFKDNRAPTALLYLFLRHALILGYWDTSLRLHEAAEIEIPFSIRREPAFIHVPEQVQVSESRWEHLYKADARITNNPAQLIVDFIPQIIFELPAARYLSEQLDALTHLKAAPTARLERVFADHIDCCSYRLDAWQLGLVHYQLAAMRYRRGDDEVFARKGLYLGAYGWLEDVRPENKALTSVELDPELDQIFNKKGDAPLQRDNTNGGYIHAPSLNHAVTAAVLRNGYLSNATPANRATLSVSLSSERVRMALAILEGIREGQSLGALLGYLFERGLHDRHNQAEVDQFIFRMRKAFPLRANRITPTKVEKDEQGNEVSIEAIEARNVMDGVSLVEHIKKTGAKIFPFGIAPLSQPNAPTTDQAAAINAEVERVLDVHDAVADLALAEGVHQAVQGNYDRVAATLETYSKGNFPPEPDIVQTPRSGVTLTHRVGLQLEAGLGSAPSDTPRTRAEPALNKWLGSALPLAADVFCKVEYFDPVANGLASHDVTLQNLQLQPIDLLYLIRPESQQAMTELDDRVLRHVITTFDPRPDAELKIKYLEKPADKISVFEVSPLMESLRSLLLRSRPLRATDIALQTESKQEQEGSVFVDKTRIAAVSTAMATLHADLTAFNATPATIDVAIAGIASLLSGAGTFGIPHSGWGFAYEWKRQAFTGVLNKVDELVNRWGKKLDEYDALIIDYNALPGTTTDQQRFDLLQRAERLISTQMTTPLPATPGDFKTNILDAKRVAFANRLNDFKVTILQTTTKSLTTLVNNVKALSVTDFDLVGIEVEESEKQIVAFVEELNDRVKSIAADVDRRLKAAQQLLTDHDNAASAAERAQLLETAAKTLLGDEFTIIPEFSLSTAQGDEWEKALAASRNGELLKYLTDPPLAIDFPVDDWLYGLARVREKLRHWEKTVMLIQALTGSELKLDPIQLPCKPNDRWLGLEFPEKDQNEPDKQFKIDGDRLLYTAQYGVPFQKAQRQCGLLLDEWNEVIPSKEETTGIAFHYDRPNSEPPQTMLLVTPATMGGAWQWRDLVDALNETLEMAKKRAVEPVHVDATPYARFLPSTVMAVTLYQISIAANLSVNNNVFAALPQGNNG